MDPETLREVVENPAELSNWLDDALSGAADHAAHAVRGVAARQLGRLELAERELTTSLRLCESPLARARLAHVYQWQQRPDLAEREFNRALADAHQAPGHEHYVWQDAGKSAYEAGEWTLALSRCATALRLRTEGRLGGDLVASSEMALNAADACVTARAAAEHLHRLVLAVSREQSAGAVEFLAGAEPPPHSSVLMSLGPLNVAGSIPLAVVAGMHRYSGGLDRALEDLAASGWLSIDGDMVTPTVKATDLLRARDVRLAEVTARLWPRATSALRLVTEAVLLAAGTSPGPVFGAFAAIPASSTPVTLFHRLEALRQHRAEAHAHAWSAEGLDVDGLRALGWENAVRRRIEAATDRVSARAYRNLTASRRGELLSALRALPGK